MNIFTTQDHIDLAYCDQGSGPVILCLAGLTRNHHDFDDFIKSCTLPARIIAVSSRGRYPSSYDQNWQNYTVAQEAADAIALLDHLKIDRAMFIGTSRGGLVSMLLSLTHPHRLASVVLNDIGPEIEPIGLQRILDRLGVMPNWENLDEAISELKERMASQFTNLNEEIWEKLVRRWYRFSDGRFALNYDPNLRKLLDLPQGNVDLWPFFEAMSARPLGLIWGENSDLLRLQTIKTMQSKNPNLRFAICPQRGHVPFLDEPEAIDLITKIFHQSFALS